MPSRHRLTELATFNSRKFHTDFWALRDVSFEVEREKPVRGTLLSFPQSAMNATARIQPRGQVTIPTRLREQAGLSKGDLVELAFEHGRIVIKPKVVIDKAQFPNADDEYTPAQRKVIEARLAKGMADIKAGRTFGPFNSAADMIADMKARLKKRSASKPARRAG